jgi:hypothetical protein
VLPTILGVGIPLFTKLIQWLSISDNVGATTMVKDSGKSIAGSAKHSDLPPPIYKSIRLAIEETFLMINLSS